jgi:phage major head subunit gpT-like protein
MAIPTPALVSALNTGFRSDFETAFASAMAASQYQQVATVTSSNTASNTYGWLGQFPNFREWIGDRQMNDMIASGYQIFNKHYESTVSVRRTDIEDDNLGVYRPLMSEMGRAAAVFPDQLIFGLLREGSATSCYDGQNFFDSEHPVYRDASGVGVSQAVSNINASGGGPNWYLLDTSRALKPLIYQSRKAPEFTLMTRADDEAVFTSGLYRYGVDLRCNVGFGFWQMAYCSNLPLVEESYATARAAMADFKADGGRPLGLMPNTLLVPPAMEGQARMLLMKDRDSGNPWYHSAELIVCPWLS